MTITSLVNRIKELGRAKHVPQRIHPQRDWTILVCTTLLLFFVLGVWNYISFQIQIGETESSVHDQNIPELKAVSIDTVQTVFSTRAQMREEYKTTRHFVDPSK